MDLIQAVKLAQEGNKEAFDFLYQSTYRSKYYLAKKYMKNEEAAEDVMQEAYLKAYLKLNTLDTPEAFSGWFGTIVANTAKNALQKKNPILFSDITEEVEDEPYEYQIEDEDKQYQPETAYTKKEIAELVHELMDSLSDEQRMCVLMFHIEELSIREIAQTLNCSENTVKSRLNYGRKNLKAKAEELQKKGYKVYTAAPVTLLIHLLLSEEKCLAAEGAFDAIGNAMFVNISKMIAEHSQGIINGVGNVAKASAEMGSAMNAGSMAEAGITKAGSIAKTGISGAVKKGFIHTLAGKIAAAALGVCLTGGIIAAGLALTDSGKEDTGSIVANNNGGIGIGKEDGKAGEENFEEEIRFTDDMYPQYIQGNLTKEELTFVLAASPSFMHGRRMTEKQLESATMEIGMGYEASGLLYYGRDSMAHNFVSLEGVNRMLSAVIDFSYSEESHPDLVDGDRLQTTEAEGVHVSAEITSVELMGMKMFIEYKSKWVYADRTTETNCIAILEQQDNGLYQVEQIWPLYEEGDKEKILSGAWDWKLAYWDVIMDAPNQTYQVSENLMVAEPNVEYRLHDMDGDSIPELILAASSGVDGPGYLSFRSHWAGFYTYSKEKGVQLADTSCYYMAYYMIDPNSNRLMVCEQTDFMGGVQYYALTLENGQLKEEVIHEEQFLSSDDEIKFDIEHEYYGTNPGEVGDFAPLMNYGRTKETNSEE